MRTAHVPAERTILRSFALPGQQGKIVDLERFRQQRNLVLFFLNRPSPAAEALLRDLAGQQDRLAEEEAEVLVVLHGNREQAQQFRRGLKIPFAVLADGEGGVTNAYAGEGVAMYVTDRFREIYGQRQGEELFTHDEVLEWLAHINRQCPE